MIRNLLYRLASLLGDFNALQRGTLPKRLIRKAAFRQSSKIINKFLK